jgi:hypothetical protein
MHFYEKGVSRYDWSTGRSQDWIGMKDCIWRQQKEKVVLDRKD